MTTYNKQQGLSLIELLVALALAASLSTAIYQIVLSNRVNIELVESHSKVQESARLALEMMARDLRMAGYTGCVNNTANINSLLDTDKNKGYDSDLHDFSSRFSGIDDYKAADGTVGGKTPVLGSDVFFSRSATTSDLYVKTENNINSAQLKISGTEREKNAINREGNVVMVTDCETAVVFAVSNTHNNNDTLVHNKNVSNGPDNIDSGLGEDFKPGSQVILMNSYAYFIAPSAVVTDSQGNAVNALYKYSQLGGSNAFELVPYVEDLQFTYGVDTDGDMSVDVYKTATEIANDGDDFSTDVKSIQFQLTIAGDTNVNANTADGFLRKSYSRVVQIRNSNLGANVAGAVGGGSGSGGSGGNGNGNGKGKS